MKARTSLPETGPPLAALLTISSPHIDLLRDVYVSIHGGGKLYCE